MLGGLELGGVVEVRGRGFGVEVLGGLRGIGLEGKMRGCGVRGGGGAREKGFVREVDGASCGGLEGDLDWDWEGGVVL